MHTVGTSYIRADNPDEENRSHRRKEQRPTGSAAGTKWVGDRLSREDAPATWKKFEINQEIFALPTHAGHADTTRGNNATWVKLIYWSKDNVRCRAFDPMAKQHKVVQCWSSG